MKSYKQCTVSVGIPVYNEVENIGYLLQSIIRQKQLSYKLEKIIVNCDGSNDGTDQNVREKAKKNRLIVLIKNRTRRGKKRRLEEIYKANKSDIIITFDGDVVLGNPYVIENMIGHFKNKNVGIVSGRLNPVREETFFGKLQVTWFRVWLEARRSYKEGNNIHNIRGACLAIRSDVAKLLKFDEKIVSDAQYIYFFTLQKKLQFRFAYEAVVLFRVPNNLRDFLAQKSRSKNGKRELVKRFGAEVFDAYDIPTIYKINSVIKMIIKEPIMTPLAGLLQIFFRLFHHFLKLSYNHGLWKGASSTKRAITIITF